MQIIPAEELPLSEQATMFTEVFAGCVGGSLAMHAAGSARFLCAQCADLCHSRFARVGGDVCGFAYVNHTFGVTRIGGMGVRPAARRTGVSLRLLEHVAADAAEAQARRDEAIILEVIEQNPAAHALYRRAGFREIDRLAGWRSKTEAQPEESWASERGLSEITLAEACHARAYSKEGVTVAICDPEMARPIRVHAVFAASDRPNSGLTLAEVLNDIIALYPGREFFAPPVFPERLGEKIFAPLHFEQERRSQFLMRCELDPEGAICH